jgi:subtilase family serine protease
LTPYQPAGWSDKIVVSTGTGTSTDSSPLIYTNTLYVDWAVINNGNSTASNFTTSLYVDGVFQTSWSTPALGSNTYTSALDYSIGSLSAGTHTVAITTDSGSVVAESSEADNTYTKTITVSTPSLPNLTPYQPVGWADKIVISTVAGTSTDNTPLFATNTIYVDWAVNNNGSVAAGSFATTLYLDGVLQQTWNTGSLSVNGYIYIQDYSLGTLNAGSHTIQITADSGGTVGESNEADNTYSRTISIGAVTAPAPTLTAPANGATSQPTTPAFSWTAVTNVTGYRILVATSAADLPTNPTNSTGGPSLVLNATSSTNAYTPVVPLNPGTTYY